MSQNSSTRIAGVNLLLVGLGAVGGALAAIPLTVLGKVVAGADPATVSNYLWNMGAFGAMSAIGSPLLTWSALRRVPLWRAVLEPAGGALAGAALGSLIGSGVGFLFLTPIGLGLAAWRLHHAYRAANEPDSSLLEGGREPDVLDANVGTTRRLGSARNRAL